MGGRVHRSLLSGIASLVAVVLAFACGTVDTTGDDPVPPDGGTARDDATADGRADAQHPDAPPDVPDGACPEVLTDDAIGVYVSAGANSSAAGTRSAPLGFVNEGIMKAMFTGRSKVYVSRGTYVGSLTLRAGVEIVGGWDVTEGPIDKVGIKTTVWKRACTAPGEIVILRASTLVEGCPGCVAQSTVEARNLDGEAGLSLLRIENDRGGSWWPTGSGYGVFAVGATTTLQMTGVRVEVGAARPGLSGYGGSGASGAVSCPPGTGEPGAAGAQGSGAPIGSFGITGYYTAPLGSPGTGAAGANGTVGRAGACVTCGSCSAYPACDFLPDPGPQRCAKDGSPGCGGGPGYSYGGTAGGSSIGVVAWDATVMIHGGTVQTGDAGNGGAGGLGGVGGSATAGAVGQPAAACVTACAVGAGVCDETMTGAAGGAAGGMGGAGGAGAAAGGGSGGSSIALYQRGVGSITTSGTTILAHGKAGAGGGPVAGAGAQGAAADRVP